jgi:hypothetical protein
MTSRELLTHPELIKKFEELIERIRVGLVVVIDLRAPACGVIPVVPGADEFVEIYKLFFLSCGS